MSIAALGMDPDTGLTLTGLDHIRMSIRRILTTPIGSCVERREFGSLLPDLVDQPLNDVGILQAVAASAQAITRWETRIALKTLKLNQDAGAPTTLTIEMEATVVDSGAEVQFQIPLSLGGTV